MFRVINEEKALILSIKTCNHKFIESNSWTQIITKWRSYEGTKIIIDSKDFGIGAQHDIDISKIRLVSNTEGEKLSMIGYVEITEYM
jgi:3,4-dihydroxy 2-butanone 4-phosphate synthase/GTP cyclohydrolase II